MSGNWLHPIMKPIQTAVPIWMYRNSELVVYTDYSGFSDQIAYLAVRKCRSTGEEYVHAYDTKTVSSKYSENDRFTEGQLKGVLWAERIFPPGTRILTDCRYAVRESDSPYVEYVPGHSGNPGNEHADYLAKYSCLNPAYGENWPAHNSS